MNTTFFSMSAQFMDAQVYETKPFRLIPYQFQSQIASGSYSFTGLPKAPFPEYIHLIIDTSLLDKYRTNQTPKLMISNLGWNQKEILATRSRLSAFEEDWNAPGMEGYDKL